jgi:anti-sigma B factor antagonist
MRLKELRREPALKGERRMSMKLTTREVNEVTILDLGGRITLGEESERLRDTVRGIVVKGSKKIILNLDEVSYIDSSGLGELVTAYTVVKKAGGELKLLNVTKKISDLLVITKLVTVFDVSDSEMAAVSSF